LILNLSLKGASFSLQHNFTSAAQQKEMVNFEPKEERGDDGANSDD
jgi:hypothetical protein